ncbi:hypothetical protein BKM07_02980 [Pseudomonas syringae group genomosp. 3]|uniref:Uncharacterized protein n=1 Tax=Pseudomonas syringae group genomosp. 3 TaxID=251701 RepID=A0ABD6VII8_9PSED|nr:hypothetical protein BKM07_02980 [Pseudomonas syringae group genomosp. 3]
MSRQWQAALHRPLLQFFLPRLIEDGSGGFLIARLMAVCAGHATTSRGLDRQLQVGATEDFHPLYAAGRHIGFFRAMGQ